MSTPSLPGHTLYGPLRREALEVLRNFARNPAPVIRLSVPMAPTVIVGDPGLIRQALLVEPERWTRVAGGLGEGALPLVAGRELRPTDWLETLVKGVDPVIERWVAEAHAGGTGELLWELGAVTLGAISARLGAPISSATPGGRMDAVEARAWIDAARAAEDEHYARAMAMAAPPTWMPTERNRRAAELEREVGQIRDRLGDGAGLAAFLVHGVPLVASAALLGLCKAPPLEAAVRSELKALGRTPGIGDLDALPALRRFLRETLRLQSPAWAIERRAAETVTVGGLEVRAGTRVLFSPWMAHRRADAWNDPEKLDPDRHKQEGGTRIQAWGGRDEEQVGEDLALPAATLIVARVMSRLKLKPMAGNPLVLTARLRLRVQNAVKVGLVAV